MQTLSVRGMWGRVEARAAGKPDRSFTEVLRRAAVAAARSVHAVRVGSAVDAFESAQARRRARRTETDSRADARFDVSRTAEKTRGKPRAGRSVRRTADAGAAYRCRYFQTVTRSAENDPRSAGASAARAERAAADGRGRRVPDAAVCRRSSGAAGRRPGESRDAAPGHRRGTQGVFQGGTVDPRRDR